MITPIVSKAETLTWIWSVFHNRSTKALSDRMASLYEAISSGVFTDARWSLILLVIGN